jgi:hypothetical protein
VDALAEVGEPDSKQRQLRVRDGDQHRPARFDAAAGELADRCDVLLVPGVEQRVVTEAWSGHTRAGIASKCRRFLPDHHTSKRAGQVWRAVSGAVGSGIQVAVGLTVSLLLAAAGFWSSWGGFGGVRRADERDMIIR